jgi:hypothetical protein
MLYISYHNSTNPVTICALKGLHSSPVVAGDWGAYSGTPYGTLTLNGEDESHVYYPITFNAQGIADIVKGGITKIAIMNYTYDYLNVDTDSDEYEYQAQWYSPEESESHPYLEITYTEEVPSGTPSASPSGGIPIVHTMMMQTTFG